MGITVGEPFIFKEVDVVITNNFHLLLVRMKNANMSVLDRVIALRAAYPQIGFRQAREYCEKL